MNQKKIDKIAFQFNSQISKKVRSIIAPLETIIPITNFSYLRFYDDGQLLHIQPDQSLLEHLLKSNFNNQGLKNKKLKEAVKETVVSSQYVWPTDNKDDLSRFLSTFGIKNTMSVITKNTDYLESLTFSNPLDEELGRELHIHNNELYQHFRAYFIDKINDVIDFNDKDIYFKSTLCDYYKEDGLSLK